MILWWSMALALHAISPRLGTEMLDTLQDSSALSASTQHSNAAKTDFEEPNLTSMPAN